MDEPFSALDAQTRLLMMEELLAIWERTRQSIVYVTHNIQEAVFMADRVVVLSRRPGRILDIADIGLARPRAKTQYALLLRCGTRAEGRPLHAGPALR